MLLLATEDRKEIPYEFVKDILANFEKVLHSNIDRVLRKQLLHMVISEITIDKRREIGSIKLKLSDELIQFLEIQKGGALSEGAPLNFYLKPLGIPYVDLELVI